MKRGHAILIGGAILLVAGIAVAAVWGISFAGSFLSNNTIVGRTTIYPGQSISAKTDVSQLDKQIALTVGVERVNGQIPINVQLKETITDPNGNIVSSNQFTDSYITSIKPQVTGAYTVTLTNIGSTPVSVGGTFGYFPMIGANGQPDTNAMMMNGQGVGIIITGGLMAFAGVITLIVGGIITVADSRRHSSTESTSSTQGGITYRKD